MAIPARPRLVRPARLIVCGDLLGNTPIQHQNAESMYPTKKDLEEASNQTAKTKARMDTLQPVFNSFVWLLSRMGFVRRRLAKTAGARIGTISRYAERGEHEAAAALAIKALKDYRHQKETVWLPKGRDYWWMYMDLAASNLEKCDDREKWEELIEMASNGIKPFQGYDVASSFLAFSRWKYRVGDHDRAIEFAQIAANADATFGEPDFLLGWYRLVLGGGDALDHLSAAVRKDKRIIFQIAKDPECRKHPHILQKLKEIAAEGSDSESAKPEAGDPSVARD